MCSDGRWKSETYADRHCDEKNVAWLPCLAVASQLCDGLRQACKGRRSIGSKLTQQTLYSPGNLSLCPSVFLSVLLCLFLSYPQDDDDDIAMYRSARNLSCCHNFRSYQKIQSVHFTQLFLASVPRLVGDNIVTPIPTYHTLRLTYCIIINPCWCWPALRLRLTVSFFGRFSRFTVSIFSRPY